MKINIHFFVMLQFACVAFINDIIIYFFKISYNISLAISFIILLIFNIIVIRNKKIIVELNLNKLDIFVYIFFIFFLIVTGIVYPDYTYDSISYHIYLQENFPIDKVNFDFFPARVYCAFLFPLGDRMYYIVRHFFGLRFGAFLSFYTILIVYYQTKRILNRLTNNSKRVSLYSYLIFLTFAFIRYVGTYYIDNFSLVFLLEIFYIILSQKELLKNKFVLYLVMIFSGIAIGIKVNNVVYVAILILYLLYKIKNDLKNIKIKDIIISLILIVLPYFVYMIDNYKQVGSILFPYYNVIFKSKYFGNYNWVDSRFGIEGILKKIVWPVVLGSQFKEYGDELLYYDPMFSIAYLVTYIYLIYNIFNKKTNVKIQTIILWFVLDVVWITIMYGYHRYGVFVIVLCNIILISILIEIIDSKKEYSKYLENKFIYNCTVLIFTIACIYGIIKYTDTENLKYLFKDTDKEEYKIEIDGIWGIPYDSSSFVSLVRKEGTPIYNLHKDYFDGSEVSTEMWNDKVLNSGKEIYTILDCYNGIIEDSGRYKYIIEDGFDIKEVVKIYTPDEIPYMNAHSTWILVKLEYVGNN